MRKPAAAVVGIMAVILAVILVMAGPAAADPPGPTDYRSEIERVEPAIDSIELAIIGGDSFLQLTADPGVEVGIVGYQGEPYLRYDADGTVWQNERSPSRWLNDDRFGEGQVPPGATAEAPPDWVKVADGGSFAWHDHRAHWMNPVRPLGAEPGDRILEAVVPIEVDGQAVSIHVISTLVAGPSLLPAIAGGLIAIAALVWALMAPGRRAETDEAADRRQRLIIAGVATAWSVAALVMGLWAYMSVPGETEPSLMLWLLPAVGVVACGWTVLLDLRDPSRTALQTLIPLAVLALGGIELAIWGWIRRTAVVRAIIPSDAPPGLDRAVVAGALILGVITVIWTARAIFTSPQAELEPETAP